MDKNPLLIYSLSAKLKKLNPQLDSHICLINTQSIAQAIRTPKPNYLLFESKHIPIILEIVEALVNSHTRFICIENELAPEDMLALLNNDIEYRTFDNFSQKPIESFIHEPKLESYNVLIVEDDTDQIALTELILKKANMAVMSITKGEQILDAIQTFNPDIILMDYYLNGITGDKLVKTIRKEEKHKFLPIVFLTSDKSVESRMKVLNAGADDLLTKPIHAELLVSALKNRMQRQFFFQSRVKQHTTINHNIEEFEHRKLATFLKNNITNKSASIIWLDVKNKNSLRKKIGFSGFKNLCSNGFKSFPSFEQTFALKLQLSEGVFVFASENLNRNQSQIWTFKLKEWLSKNYFTIHNKDYQFDVVALILANIPLKSNKKSLLSNAENILIDNLLGKDINFLEEGVEEEKFNVIKAQLEKAIKTRDLSWHYQAIISTQDQSEEIFQLMLRVGTDTGKELSSSDYLDVANKTGLLRLLDRFTLEHAIRMIRAGEQQKAKTKTLLNQILSDYHSKKIRTKKFDLIKSLKLPKGTMIFQFGQNDAKEHISILETVGKELLKANIKVCLSDFDATKTAWAIAKKLSVNWVRLKKTNDEKAPLDTSSFKELSNSIKKAHSLGYKVIVTQVDSADFAASLWKLNIDYLQGNFIQPPIKDV